jgi:large subunit ribosomal protein L15
MITLSNLKNTHRPKKKIQRVGRGPGSGRGKTCQRGSKGDKARCGYKQRYGEEGGQKPLYRKLPTRGFSNSRFRKPHHELNFQMINDQFRDGEKVTLEILHQKGLLPQRGVKSLKILSKGKLEKKVSIEAHALSQAARKELEDKSISFKLVERSR